MIPRELVVVAALSLPASAAPGQSLSGSEAATSATEQTARAQPAPPDADLREIRNIFRYRSEPRVDNPRPAGPETMELTPSGTIPSPPARVRFIGLMRRAERRAAALAIDGEVVLLQEGETEAGYTVLGIRDEEVLLRDPEGNEATLELP